MKAPYGWGWGGPHRHEEQKIKGVVENKPLPVNSNDTKVVARKLFKRNSNLKLLHYIIRGPEILY